MWLYSVTRLAVIWPTFFTAQATFPLVVDPGARLASNPHFSVTQFMPSSSLARMVTRGSFRPLLAQPSSTKCLLTFTPSSFSSSARGNTTKSHRGFVSFPVSWLMHPFTTP